MKKKIKDPKKVAMGKKSKAAGKAFEDRGYLDLEKKGWIVSRWMKNVSDYPENNINLPPEEREDRKLIPAKPKIRMIPGKGPMLVSTWTGFPDFIAFRYVGSSETGGGNIVANPTSIDTWKESFAVIGVEFKMDGKLDKEEKEKCKWLISNNVFSKILIAEKGKKRGEIIYKEFKNG